MSCSIKIAPCLESFILSKCAGSNDSLPAQHKRVHSVGFEQPNRFSTRDSTPSFKSYDLMLELINDLMLIVLIISRFKQRKSFIIINTR